MITTNAPLNLPFAPKPIQNEIFSSWLLRVAAANFVTLEELLAGFHASYPEAAYVFSLDLNLDQNFLKFIARFSRVPFGAISRSRLETWVTDPEAALPLRFNNDFNDQRQQARRVGYAFCPHCIVQQSHIHVKWDWTFFGLLHCSLHGIPLVRGCHSCGDLDPLPFGLTLGAKHIPCRSCDEHLLIEEVCSRRRSSSFAVIAFEKSYRSALLGQEPDLAVIGGTNSMQFRRFVDDTLRMLVTHFGERPPRYGKLYSTPTHSREAMVETISRLVLNSCSHYDRYERKSRYSKVLRIWHSLLDPLSPEAQRSLVRTSHAWPPSIRRRLASVCSHTSRTERRTRGSVQFTPSAI